MTLPLVIINPTSAGGATQETWPRLASDLRTHFGPFTCVFTEYAGHATDLALESARAGVQFIIACGGDGTISEIANGILNSGKNTELGILPSGTGGDFRRSLSIPLNSREAARILREGTMRKIDVGRASLIDFSGNQFTRYFLGVASFGMSAEVIGRVKERSEDWLMARTPGWFSGRVSYGISMLQTALQLKPTRVVVQLDDDKELRLSVANLCVANARYFGGGMKIAPNAKLTDGKFDIVSIADMGSIKALANAPRIYFGSHLTMPEVGHTLAEKIVVRPDTKDEQVIIELDGELLGCLPATFHIVPQALRVRCPR